MEVNAFTVNKLEANRHRSPQYKEILITSDSPPDVGRPLVPPEDLDRVDGIRPSSSRTRAVALLPAIEESVEEGPESLQVETPGEEGKLERRGMSSKPMLTSISEERIPRLWEYPVGESNTERDRPSGQSLGAGEEAPSMQLGRDHLSPVTLDKNLEGDVLLVEAGDAEAKEGNRSNHALGEPDSGQEEKAALEEAQSILLTSTSAVAPGDTIEDLGPENRDGAHGVEDSTPGELVRSKTKSYDVSEPLRMDTDGAFQTCVQATLLKFPDGKSMTQSQDELEEMDKVELLVLPDDYKQEISLEEVASTENVNLEPFKLVDSVQTSDVSCVDSSMEGVYSETVVGCSEDNVSDEKAEIMKESVEKVNNTIGFGDSADFERGVFENVQVSEIEREMEIKKIVCSEDSGNQFSVEEETKATSDGLVNETFQVGDTCRNKDFNALKDFDNLCKEEFQSNDEESQISMVHCPGDHLTDADLLKITNKKFDEAVGLENLGDGDDTVELSIRSISGTDQNDIKYSTEKSDKWETVPTVAQTLNTHINKTDVSLHSTANDNRHLKPLFYINMCKSLDPVKSALWSDADLEINPASEVQINLSKVDHHQEYLSNVQCENLPGENKQLPSLSCVDSFELCTTEEQVVMVKEISSLEDSVVCSSGPSRAKGSGSDSMVADGNLSAADVSGARESHSDHTSGPDKVDQTTKTKDGFAKTRGRERERIKRKRADREDREDRGGSPGDKQKLLKNAVGDVPVEVEDPGEADTENAFSVVKTSPLNDIVGLESRTIRAASSGDIHDNAVKSTCGLESQTVTSLDDSSGESVESANLWEQEQGREDSDNLGQLQTPPKGIATSRFGKRTQLNRQKQASPQEQDLTAQATEKINVDIRVLGLGDSGPEPSAKTHIQSFSLPGDSVCVAQLNSLNIGQNESCNNPTDPFSVMDNPDGHLQAEIGMSIDESSLNRPESQAAGHSGEQDLQNIERSQTEQGSLLICQSVVTPTNEKASDPSENLLHSLKFTDAQACVYNTNTPEKYALEMNVNDALDLDNKHMIFKTPNHKNIGTNSKSEMNGLTSNNASIPSFHIHETCDKDINISYDFEDIRSENRAGNGASCCRHGETFDNRSPTSTNTDGQLESDSQSSSSYSSETTSKTGTTAKSEKGFESKTQKRLSNFDSIFGPRMCSSDLPCLPHSSKPGDLEANVSSIMSSKPQPSSLTEDNQHSSHSDISEISDRCNPIAAHESGAQTLILSENFQSLHHEDLVDVPHSAEAWMDSHSDKSLQAKSFENDQFAISLQDEQVAHRLSQIDIPDKPSSLCYMQESQKEKPSENEEMIYLQEGLHIPHDNGNNDETSLINALAEAAKDCSPPEAKFDSAQEQVSPSDTIKIKDEPIENKSKGVTSLQDFPKDLVSEIGALGVEQTDTIEPAKPQDELPEMLIKSNTESTLADAENRHCSQSEDLEQTQTIDDIDNVPRQLDSQLYEIQVNEEHAKIHEQPYEVEHATAERNIVSEADKIDIQQVSKNEASLDKGDYPITFNVSEDTELWNKVGDSNTEFVEGEEKRPSIELQVMTALQNTATLASPFAQRRPNTPVAGDGDCVEKEDSETMVKLDQTDWVGEPENKGSGAPYFNDAKDVEEKEKCTELPPSEDKIIADGNACVRNNSDFKTILVEVGNDKYEPVTHQMKDIVEDTKDIISLLEQKTSTNVDSLDSSNDGPNCTAQPNLCTSSEKISSNADNTAEPGRKQSEPWDEESVRDIVVENAEATIMTNQENDEEGDSEKLKSSHQGKNKTTEKNDVWADMVIREADKVFEDYHQNQEAGHVNEQNLYEDTALEASLDPSRDMLGNFQKSLIMGSVEPDREIIGRSKDGGKRAKRSKQYGKLENEVTASQYVSRDHVRRITLVDVEDYPKDKPCVYRPDREGDLKSRDRVVASPELTRDGDNRRKRGTFWSRIKTMFHPRRFVSKERKYRVERDRSKVESAAQEEHTKSNMQVRALHLRKPAKSDDTLDVLQGESGGDHPIETTESWPCSHHKVKARSPGQWHRLKKFRALRHSAERRGVRLPATMRQVVSKNNYVREAEGDHPSSTGRQDGNHIPQGKRKSSSGVPLLKQNQMSSWSSPEVAQVLRMDEHLIDCHFSPGQPKVQSLLKPDPVVTLPKDCDGLVFHPTMDGTRQDLASRLHQEKNNEEESKGNRSAFRKWERGESDYVPERNNRSKKANTYHCHPRSRTYTCNAKDKANTHPRGWKNQQIKYSNENTRSNKNCRLM